MKRIQVAVGVIQKGNKVLIGQRCVQDQYFKKWEFPGGKIEKGESASSALKRELSEELGIEVVNASPLIRIDHDYPDRKVSLYVFWVDNFLGEPKGIEGQAIKWVKPENCYKEDFLAANEPIVNAVSLPKQFYITNIQKFGLDRTLEVIGASAQYYENNSSRENQFAVQLREKNASEEELKTYLAAIKQLSPNHLVFLNGEYDVALKLGFDGVHLSSMLAKNRANSKSGEFGDNSTSGDFGRFWVGTSCHTQIELEQSEKFADFSFLSPVQKTTSHPEKLAMGWNEFSKLVTLAKQPVYALGGLSKSDVLIAQEHGGQGVAAISSVWTED